MSDTISGNGCIKVLCRHFGFVVVGQKGSHVKLRRKEGGRTITTIVPVHRELSPGTLHGALKLAEVDDDAFWSHL